MTAFEDHLFQTLTPLTLSSDLKCRLYWTVYFLLIQTAFFSTLFVFCVRSCTSSSKRDTFSSILARLAETSLRCASILWSFSNLSKHTLQFQTDVLSSASNTPSVSLFLHFFLFRWLIRRLRCCTRSTFPFGRHQRRIKMKNCNHCLLTNIMRAIRSTFFLFIYLF